MRRHSLPKRVADLHLQQVTQKSLMHNKSFVFWCYSQIQIRSVTSFSSNNQGLHSIPTLDVNIVSHQQDGYVKRGQNENQISLLGPIWLEAPKFDPRSQVKTKNDKRTKCVRPHIWNSWILHLVTMNVLLRFGERTRHLLQSSTT